MKIKTHLLWNKIEKKKAFPKYIREIKILSFQNFNKKINSGNIYEINKIIRNLYNGDFYIIRNTISNNQIKNLKTKLVNYSKKNKSSFHKMLEGVPNYWRKIDEKQMNKYSFKVIKSAWYFFRWNKDKMKVWKLFSHKWSLVKYLMGLNPDEYVKNTPKNKVIDRIQIVQYPKNTGFCQSHWHSPKNQRIIISFYFSQIKKDFLSGGTYFYRKGKKKFKVEEFINKGDMGLFYSTLIHGVDPVIVENKKIKNNLTGRWWCGLYSPESNEVKKRTTSKVA